MQETIVVVVVGIIILVKVREVVLQEITITSLVVMQEKITPLDLVIPS